MSIAVARILTFAALVAFSGATRAEHLGVIGPVYPIAEPDLLQVILARLREAQASGKLEALQLEAQARARRAIEAPEPVTTVTKTTAPRSFHFDPSLTLPYAITDADGTVMVAAGTTVNPLDTVSLSKRLLFIDARDAEQVRRAEAIRAAHAGKVKVILTGGSYLDLMRRWKHPVWFDQQGTLVEKLGIRQVPALVSQDGKRLRIDELL
jgi:conjugal transfer pilus assembly protein TraW